MKRTFLRIYLLVTITFVGQSAFSIANAMQNEPDSVYLFSYATNKNHNHNGLHFAWSTDQENWKPIGPEFRFLSSDYGSWGSEKRMLSPYLFQGNDGWWHCVWSVNEYDGTIAHATSKDLVHWKPQAYPGMMDNNNCLEPEISYDKNHSQYTISWLSTKSGESKVYCSTTKDFKNYSPAKPLPENDRLNLRKEVVINGYPETGTLHKVPWKLLEGLIQQT